MPAPCSYDYAILRVVPRVERGEFVNAGVIVFCRERGFLAARIELPRGRLRALAPDPDMDMEIIERHLAAVPAICAGDAAAGPVAALSPSERFQWLTAPRSTVIQTSPVHAGRTTDPQAELDDLFEEMVRCRS